MILAASRHDAGAAHGTVSVAEIVDKGGSAERAHLPKDPRLSATHVGGRCICAQPQRTRQDGREECCLRGLQLRGAAIEVPPTRGLDAPGAAPELRDVQIDLEDPLLAPGELDQDRKAGFETLAK